MYLDSPLGASPSTTKYDGMDFWAFCLEGDVPGLLYTRIVRPQTPEEYMERRGIILKEILQRIVAKGNIAIPSEFENDFDYETQIVYLAGSESDINYYKTRGFPGQMGPKNFTIAPLKSISNTSMQRNFIDYMYLAIRYERDVILNLYPEDKYPKIIKYYDFVVNYLKKNYEWDITKIAVLPVLN